MSRFVTVVVYDEEVAVYEYSVYTPSSRGAVMLHVRAAPVPLVADPLNVCRATRSEPFIKSQVPTSEPDDVLPPLPLSSEPVKEPLYCCVLLLPAVTWKLPNHDPLIAETENFGIETEPYPVAQAIDPPPVFPSPPFKPKLNWQSALLTVHVPRQLYSSVMLQLHAPVFEPVNWPEKRFPVSLFDGEVRSGHAVPTTKSNAAEASDIRRR